MSKRDTATVAAVEVTAEPYAMDELAPIRTRRLTSLVTEPIVAKAATSETGLIVLVGSGNVGKSVIARLIGGWAQAGERDVGLADADRHHPTLSGFFEGVMRPDDAVEDGAELTDAAMKVWFESVVVEQLKARMSVVFDIGGGDTVFARVADDLQLVSVLESEGIMPVAIHVLSPRVQDLTDLQDMEAGSYRPAHTILVLNEGAIRGDATPQRAFDPIRKHPVYKAAIARGAVEVVLPALTCMREIDRRRISFEQAAAGTVKPGQAPLSPFDAGRVRAWLKLTETAFAPVRAWLP